MEDFGLADDLLQPLDSPNYNVGIDGSDGSVTAGNYSTMVNGLGKLNVWGNSDVSDADVELRLYDNDTTSGSAVPAIAFYKGSGGGPVRMADIRVNDVLGFQFRKNSGTDLLDIGMDGKLRSYYGFAEGSTFANYYTKRSAQIQAGANQKLRARIGRVYWCTNHWSSNGINLHCRVTQQYYASGNRTYHIQANYGDYSQLSKCSNPIVRGLTALDSTLAPRQLLTLILDNPFTIKICI